MNKKLIIGVIIAFVVGFVSAMLYPWSHSEEKIRQLEKDLADYKSRYNEIKTTADSLDNITNHLQAEGIKYLHLIDSLKSHIVDLEIERKDQIVRVAEIDQPHNLIAQLEEQFPAFKNKPMGLIEMKNPRTGKGVTSFYLPVMFITSFIQDRIDVKSFKIQKAAWESIGLNYESYTALQDSVIKIKEEKAAAYSDGMKYGMARYDSLVQDYIGTLKNPPSVEFPNVGSIAIGTAIGLITGAITGGLIAK